LSLVVADVTDGDGGVIVGGLQFECLDSRNARVLLITDSRWDAIELEASACGARP
jgi:hypothetical protein